MSDSWYCQCGGRLLGPVSLGEIQRLANERKLLPADEVRVAGEAWRIASTVGELKFPAPPGQPGGTSPLRRRLTRTMSDVVPVPRGWSRHLHLVLLLALLPLILFNLQPRSSFRDKFLHSLQAHPEVISSVQPLTDEDGNPNVGKEKFLAVFPEHKLAGAVFGFDTMAHWPIAGAAAVGFLALLLAIFPGAWKQTPRLVRTGLFTGTIGIFLLLAFQWIAFHVNVRPVGAASLIVTFIFKFIAYSYTAAEDPHNGFLFSFAGYTLGIGLCEELVKFLPLLVAMPARGDRKSPSWQTLLLLGLASGVGFGIAEGVIYSSRYYNGIEGSCIYYVRFVSCVALHAVWAGAGGLMLYNRQHWLHDANRSTYFAGVVGIIFMPMLLHGLYDTFLKLAARDVDQNYHIMAVLVAMVSFGWLALQITHLQRMSSLLKVQPFGVPPLGGGGFVGTTDAG